MGFSVKYSELERFKEKTTERLTKFTEDVNGLKKAFDRLCGLKAFQGQTADAIRAYIQEVHFPIIESLLLLFSLYRNRILIYRDGYTSSVDKAPKAHMKESELNEACKLINRILDQLDDRNRILMDIMSSISSVTSVPDDNRSKINSNVSNSRYYAGEAERNASGLSRKISEYESGHISDLLETDALIHQLKTLITLQLSDKRVSPRSYVPGDAAKIFDFSALDKANQDATVAIAATQFAASHILLKEAMKQAKLNYIESTEEEHPEYKEKFDKYLKDSGLSEEEIMDVKYIVYNAPEPYRTIYLEHLSEYKIAEYDTTANGGSGGAWFNSGDNTIHLDGDQATYNCPGTPYETFFHESGHAIDDFENKFGYYTGNYKYNGKTLDDILVDDVRNNIRARVESRGLTDDEVDRIMRSLNLTDDASFESRKPASTGDQGLDNIRDSIISEMRSDLQGYSNSSASDVYGGVTNNVINGGFGHYGDNYWYSDNGNATGKQSRELWAEFFSAKMTNDTAQLKSIQEHFPEAYKAMEAMAASMVSN